MVKKSKEVQGLLYKVAELETLLIVLIGMLDAKSLLTKEEIEAIFGMAEIPEILIARIQRIESQGEQLIEARKRVLRESLGIDPSDEDALPNSEELEEYEELLGQIKDPDDKLH